VKLYTHSGSPDYINICQCLMFLDDPAGVASILDKLVKGDTVSLLQQLSCKVMEGAFNLKLANSQPVFTAVC
jgi:26S proteasome regulatory subunit N2